jgi:hypothetical protein
MLARGVEVVILVHPFICRVSIRSVVDVESDPVGGSRIAARTRMGQGGLSLHRRPHGIERAAGGVSSQVGRDLRWGEERSLAFELAIRRMID